MQNCKRSPAGKGYPGAAANMARLAKNMSPSEIAESDKRAVSYGKVQ